MIEMIIYWTGIIFYWLGVIICSLLAYILPAWYLNRYEKKRLLLAWKTLETSKAAFAQEIKTQEAIDKYQGYLCDAYQKQVEAIEAYKNALKATDKVEEIRQKIEIKVEKLTQENRQLRCELENSRERSKRLKKLQVAHQQKEFIA